MPARSSLGGHQQYKAEEVNEFLANLEGCAAREVRQSLATNEPDKIDSAVRRSGRFDKLIFIPPPDAEARRAMLDFHLLGRPIWLQSIPLAWPPYWMVVLARATSSCLWTRRLGWHSRNALRFQTLPCWRRWHKYRRRSVRKISSVTHRFLVAEALGGELSPFPLAFFKCLGVFSAGCLLGQEWIARN